MKTLTKAFRQALYENKRDYLITASITLLNNKTLSLTNDRIWSGGLSLDDAVSDDGSFGALGSTVINSASLIINNEDEAYSSYDFKDATVVISVGMKLKNGNSTRTETIKKGTYIVDEATYTGSLINLYCLDKMEYFDRPYKNSTLSYPATLLSIVRDACTKCDVILQTTSFPHSDYVVKERPDNESTTFRDVIGWAATIAGCFARMNADGKLELKWFDTDTLESRKEGYDGGTFKPWNTADVLDGGTFNPWSAGSDADMGDFTEEKPIHYINNVYSEDIAIDDTVITQIKILTKEETEDGTVERIYTIGSKGYTIEISNNDFITVETAQTVADWLGAQIIGLTYRKANLTHSNTPAIEAGDIGVVWDRKGREYPILITRTCFSPTSSQTTVSASETPSRNNATRYSQRTKAYVDARKLVTQEKSARELQLENLANALASHSGLYSTQEAQQDGSTIYYLHDMPDLEESQVIWKMTSEAWGVSTDGGSHWNAGMTVDGNTIVNILTAVGVNADWIDTGSLVVKKNSNTILSADVSTGVLTINAKDTNGNTTFSLNSSTGAVTIRATDFKLVSGSTVQTIKQAAALTKSEMVSKLGENESSPGIYLSNNVLKIRADAITTGTISSVNGNTSWNLNDGTFTMKKGTIDIGSQFGVSSTGVLTCSGASVTGTITGGTKGSSGGYWMELTTGGKLTGGYQNTQYGYVDCSAGVYEVEDPSITYRGVQIQGGCLRISTRIITVARSTSVSTTSTQGVTGSVSVVYNVGGDGFTLSDLRSNTLKFINGICVLCP